MDKEKIVTTLIAAEQNSKGLEITSRMINAATKLEMPSRQRLVLLLPWTVPEKAAADPSLSGLEAIYRLDHPLSDIHPQETFLAGLLDLQDRICAEVILFSNSAWGTEMAARTASRLGTGLMHDLIDIEVEPGGGDLTGVCTEPQNGLLRRKRFKGPGPRVATINPDAFHLRRGTKPCANLASIQLESDSEPFGISLRRRLALPPDKDIPLEAAEVVVAGGAGVHGEAGFSMLKELAALLNGAPGCTLPPVEKGLMERDLMIGATGRMVHPKWYIGCGISGDFYHTSGMENSENIVVINNDEKAPFFSMADYGIIGDLHEIIPCMIEMLREERNKNKE